MTIDLNEETEYIYDNSVSETGEPVTKRDLLKAILPDLWKILSEYQEKIGLSNHPMEPKLIVDYLEKLVNDD